MIILLLFFRLACITQVSEIQIEIPDSVEVGVPFAVVLKSTDPELESITCNPQYSDGLEFITSSSMRSQSSYTSPSGSFTTEQTVILRFTFVAREESLQTIGPFRTLLHFNGTSEYLTLPEKVLHVLETGTISGSVGTSGSYGLGRRIRTPVLIENEVYAWIECEGAFAIDHFPGQPFEVVYYLYSREQFVSLNTDWSPAENAFTKLIEFREDFDWEYVSPGLWRGHLVALEINPSLPGSLTLPIITTEAEAFSSSFIRTSPRRIVLESEVITLPVYPYPEDSKPQNFSGIAFCIEASIQKINSAGGQGEEGYVRLTITGDGAFLIDSIPHLTLKGPARLLEVASGENDTCRWWDLIIDPTGEGTVILGPNSLAWFDTESLEYRQCLISPCTLIINNTPQIIEPVLQRGNNSDRKTFLIIIIFILLISTAGIILFFKSSGHISMITDPSEAEDPEELMTAFEFSVTLILMNRSCHISAEDLEEILSEKDMDSLLARSLLRLWKDIEHLLAGVEHTGEDFNRLRARSIELLDSLRAEIDDF